VERRRRVAESKDNLTNNAFGEDLNGGPRVSAGNIYALRWFLVGRAIARPSDLISGEG
jgi:hypothetical protein